MVADLLFATVVVIKSATQPAGGTANLLDETFNTGGDPGFDLTWTETGDAQCDENATTNPPITGVTGFATEALRIADTTDNERYVASPTFAASGTTYVRMYVYLEDFSTSLLAAANGTRRNIAALDDATGSISTTSGSIQLVAKNNAGVMQLCIEVDDDDCNAGTNAVDDTGYLVEFSWNDTTDAWEFRVNGSTIGSCTSSCAAAAVNPTRIILGHGTGSAFTRAVWYDKVGVGNTGFIGP